MLLIAFLARPQRSGITNSAPSAQSAPRRLAATLDVRGDMLINWLSLATGAAIALFFAVALLLAEAGQARASECKGVDLTASITDPALLSEIESATASTPNGDALLWKIEKPGGPVSYLFGTMHVTDPRVINLPPAAEQAFTTAESLVIETTDVLDPAKASIAMMAKPELMMFVDGSDLTSRIPPEDLAMVTEKLAARGMPLGSVRLMKPWMLAGVLATPACEAARKGKGAEILDIHLATRAKAAGKPVEGLETMVEQIGAMASLPIEDHVKGLVETLRMGDMADDVFETMIALYAAGDTARIMPTLNAALLAHGATEADARAAEAFEEKMIVNRNRIMAQRLPAHLAEGGAFVAVGALHLPGKFGIVALLREAGYQLTPIN